MILPGNLCFVSTKLLVFICFKWLDEGAVFTLLPNLTKWLNYE
jgi:hypothetical protein